MYLGQYDSEYWNRAGDGNRNEYWLEVDEFDEYLLKKERGRLADEIHAQLNLPGKKSKLKSVLDDLDLKKESDRDKFIVPDRKFPRLAFRAIARDTDTRTMIASVIPVEIGAQNSLWTSIPKHYVLRERGVVVEEYDLVRLFFAQVFFNSIVFDWTIRCSIAINVNKTYIWRMPMPQPSAAEIDGDTVYMKLARNSLRLSAFYNEQAFYGFFGKFGLSSSDKILEAKIADMTRRENDALIAKLYGLEKSDMAVILETFSVMNDHFPGYGRPCWSFWMGDPAGLCVQKREYSCFLNAMHGNIGALWRERLRIFCCLRGHACEFV